MNGGKLAGMDSPYWELISARSSKMLDDYHSGRRPVAVCVECEAPIPEFSFPSNATSIRKTKRVGPFKTSQAHSFLMHTACMDVARPKAEAEGLIWGDVEPQ